MEQKATAIQYDIYNLFTINSENRIDFLWLDSHQNIIGRKYCHSDFQHIIIWHWNIFDSANAIVHLHCLLKETEEVSLTTGLSLREFGE